MMEEQIYITIRKPFQLSKKQLHIIVRQALKKRSAKSKHIELWVVGRKKMQSLNKRFMHKERPTDVLSFPLETIPAENRFKSQLIGTVVVCNDIIIMYAKESGNSFFGEASKLIFHGVDHLLGIHHK